MTEHTRRGATGLILPAPSQIGNPGENTLLPALVAELQRLGIELQEVALDGGFQPRPTSTALASVPPCRVFIVADSNPAPTAHNAGCADTERCRGRISHLKRRYGMDRSRLKGHHGQRIWTEWSILAYNTDTLAVRSRKN